MTDFDPRHADFLRPRSHRSTITAREHRPPRLLPPGAAVTPFRIAGALLSTVGNGLTLLAKELEILQDAWSQE